jgi:hypothetical protein
MYEDWIHGAFYGSRGTFFADVTGDGRADAIAVNDDTRNRAPPSASSSRAPVSLSAGQPSVSVSCSSSRPT